MVTTLVSSRPVYVLLRNGLINKINTGQAAHTQIAHFPLNNNNTDTYINGTY